MSVIDDIQTVLASTVFYAPTSSPEMDERAAVLKSMAAQVREWLPLGLQVGDEVTTLKVDYGGQKGGVSPTPWVRVFARDFSPSATEGFYLVYLFAGDGSRVYLSLNQGTSEFRSGHVRPMSDTAALRLRSDSARQFFAGWAPEFLEGLRTDIDLRVASLDVGVQPKKRASNYEAANVFALAYDADVPTTDEQLRADLDRMLELLRHLYYAVSQPDGASGTGTAIVSQTQPGGGNSGQVPVADSSFKKAVEDYSMKIVMAHYAETLLWDVGDVSRYSSWDIELTSKSDKTMIVHVEVKGTATAGASVFLTRNEVEAAQGFSHTILAIVHDIKVASDAEKNLVCSGGVLTIHDPWVPAQDHLTPKQYIYEVPAGGISQPVVAVNS